MNSLKKAAKILKMLKGNLMIWNNYDEILRNGYLASYWV